MNPVEIVRRVDLLKVARSSIERIWNDVDKYIAPLRLGDMYLRPVAETAINLLRDDVFDSTAIHASQRMANAMHGSITNPSVKWRDRMFRKAELNKDPESREWLQQSNEVEWNELYDSNFDPEISSAYQDLVVAGNTFFATEAEKDSPVDWAGFNFAAMPLKESFFERDHRGEMYRYYRWLEPTASWIKSKFPDAKLPEKIEKALADGGNPDSRFALIYAVYVRDDKKNRTGLLAPLERPVGYKYVLKDSKEELGEEGGFYEMPILHCPWEQTAGSVWGHGPGMIMAPTVKYINYWLELEDLAARMMLQPPTMAEERGLIDDLDLQPGGFTVVRDINKVKPFPFDSKFDLTKMSIEDLRKMVREAFHNDELQLRDSPQMSATEAQIRYELMNRVLGPTMGRIQNSLLSKVLDRTFKTLLRNKQFPPPPKLVLANKAQLKVVYTGALMRAQQSDEVAAIERWVGQIGAIAKVFPAVMNLVDIIAVGREMATRLGVPAKMLRSDKEVQDAVMQQQQVAAQQAKLALTQQKGQADEAVGKGQAALQGPGVQS